MTFSQNEEGDGTNYAATSGTIGRSGLPSFPGAGDMMTEMASKLRERRIKADGGTQVSVFSVLPSILNTLYVAVRSYGYRWLASFL